MRTPLRSLVLKIHLYLGLTAGAVILVLCLTGAILSFEGEITTARYPERYHVEGTGAPVPLAIAVEAIRVASPDAKIGSVMVSAGPGQPWDFSLGQAGRTFVDPYTGRVIASGVRRAPFFQKTMELHRWLLADELGGKITGAATVMFVVLLFAGIFLWWPKTKGAFKARINPFAVFSKHGGGRRKLHDLHVALGIWCWPFLLMVALTGLPEAYGWATNALFAVTRSERPTPAPHSTSDTLLAPLSVDSVLALGRATFPAARLWTARMPQRPNSAAAVSAVDAADPVDRHSDVAYFDRVTGELLRVDRYAEMSTGVRARRMVEPWHTGAAWGFPGKLLIFLVVLLGASFPVTGFLMYRAGKRNES